MCIRDRDNTAVEIIRLFRIKLIRNADEPDIMGREIPLNVISVSYTHLLTAALKKNIMRAKLDIAHDF